MARLSWLGVSRELRRRLFSRWYVDTHTPYDHTVLVTGTSRSGTTWVADVINYRNSHRVLFEPFHRRVLLPLGAHAFFDVYRRRDDDEKELYETARRILEGRIRDEFVDAHNRRFLSQRRIAKDVSGNVTLPWLKARFPALPVVFVLRHPCAVAQSKISLGWDDVLEFYVQQEPLRRDYLEPHARLLAQARTAFQKHVLQWCIENVVPLRELGPADAHVIFYEHLRRNPHDEVPRLFEYLGLPYSDKIFGRMTKGSLTSRKGWTRFPAGNIDRTSFDHTGEADLSWLVSTLAAFGLDHLYGWEALPKCLGDEVLRRPVAADADTGAAKIARPGVEGEQ